MMTRKYSIKMKCLMMLLYRCDGGIKMGRTKKVMLEEMDTDRKDDDEKDWDELG
jgi:hypothetical protein